MSNMLLVDRICQFLTVTLNRLPIRLLSWSHIFLNSSVPTTASRYHFPLLVIFKFISLNIPLAVSYFSGFTISHDLFTLGKYPIFGPKVFSLFLQVSIFFNFPTQPTSSIYTTYFVLSVAIIFNSAKISSTYISIAVGSPWVVRSADVISLSLDMKSLASRLYEFMIKAAFIWHTIRMLWSIMFLFIWLNALSATTNKIALLSYSISIDLKTCTAVSPPTCGPAQSWKPPARSRVFHLKIFITVRSRILLITSPVSIGLTSEFLSKGIILHAKKASSDASFPQYLFKHNFFVMSSIALQRSRLLHPNDDEV